MVYQPCTLYNYLSRQKTKYKEKGLLLKFLIHTYSCMPEWYINIPVIKGRKSLKLLNLSTLTMKTPANSKLLIQSIVITIKGLQLCILTGCVQMLDTLYRLLDSLVVECRHRVREVPGSRTTSLSDYKNGTR